MNPNSAPSAPPPIEPPTASTDPTAYLDAIAIKPEKNHFLSGKMLVVLVSALAVLILVIIISVIAGNARQAASDEAIVLGEKLADLEKIIKYGQSNSLSSSNTIKIVAETNLIIQSRQTELSKIYTLTNEKTPTTDKPSITTDLDNAKARGNLDKVYATTLRDQLLAVCKQLEIMYDSAKTDVAKAALTQAYQDFKELASRLSAD